MRRALVGCLALSVAAPPLGVFLVLRRMSLTADVLLAGLAVAVGAGALSRATGGREDASFAALYLIALALGVALVSMGGGGAVELNRLLFGSALGVDDEALLLMAGTATLTLLVLAFAWRPLVLECFDPAFGASVGARGAWWHLSFMALLVLNLLAAFQALGTLMSVGLMMLPAIAARHWSREVGGVACAAVALAAGSSVAGLLVSFHADVPTGPAVVLSAGLGWAVSVLAGPVDGLAGRLWRRRHLAG
jgi:zinc/manganese transport system permease protein